MHHTIKYFTLLCFFIIAANGFSQYNVGIGTTAPAKDAILDIKSSTQGVLLPRLSTTQRLAIVNPSNGLMVFDTNYNCIYVYIAPSAAWQSYCPPPVGPPVNSNVQVYTSQANCTLFDTIGRLKAVSGLSITVTLTDTATVILSTNGNVIDAGSGAFLQFMAKLYQNGSPILGTSQSIAGGVNGLAATIALPVTPINLNWCISNVLSLLPGTYVFEVKIELLEGDKFEAGCNSASQGQGIITAEVIYK